LKLRDVERVMGVVDPTSPVPKEAWPSLLSTPPPELAAQIEQSKRLGVGTNTVLFDVVTDEKPDSARAQDLVRELRKLRDVGDGTLLVGGETANNVDSAAFLFERAPRLVALVVAVTYVVLFVSLASVLLPLKAVLMNFLSISASFGALVWVFQYG